MLLLQSIKFLLQPLEPRRTSIRPVGSARAVGRSGGYDIGGLIDCRAPCNYSTSGSGSGARRAAFIGYYLS